MHFRAPKLNGTKETCHTQSAIVADHLMNLQEVLAESPDYPLRSHGNRDSIWSWNMVKSTSFNIGIYVKR